MLSLEDDIESQNSIQSIMCIMATGKRGYFNSRKSHQEGNPVMLHRCNLCDAETNNRSSLLDRSTMEDFHQPKRIRWSTPGESRKSSLLKQRCHPVDSLEGEEPEMFWGHQQFHSEVEDEFISPFFIFSVNKNTLKKQDNL